MIDERLNSANKLYTPASGTTSYIDYSAKKRILEVQFEGGKAYHYFNVEPSVWEEYKKVIITGESSGAYVNTKIKPVYRYTEVK
jgi:hypothetical protein